jgi:5-methyltetrahydropteroyltriglutamate--homocysteine methyltransferase
MPQRILTTHAGSLPKPPELAALHARRFAGESIDLQELAQRSLAATAAVVRRQCDTGIDSVNNGEIGRESFFTYVRHRMSGFSGVSVGRRCGISSNTRSTWTTCGVLRLRRIA